MNGFLMEPYYGIDITEIDGFDNLHCPEGILKEIMDRAGRLFGAETYLLVNGSTGGILSAVSAAVRRGETILMARNCHQSVFHAVYLNECKTEYIYPQILEKYGLCGGISPESVRAKLADHPEIRAVCVTSPTYDGVVSDVKAIAEEAHRHGIPLIVDEAHGAHFGLDKRFPKSAVEMGADLVIHSIHKTLPALTQTALLHVQGERISRERLRRFLSVYQTSSPSYILLAGIEQCVSILEQQGRALCHQFFEWNRVFEERIEHLRYLHVFSDREADATGIFAFDPCKKIICTVGSGLTGRTLYDRLLHDYGLQMEMAGQTYATAIMTVMDREEGFVRLADALDRMDTNLTADAAGETGCDVWESADSVAAALPVLPAFAADTIASAMEREQETVLLEACSGRIAAEFIHIYPPGIPLIVPGEYFTDGLIRLLCSYRAQGFTIEGMREHNQKVCVIGREQYA